LTLKSIYTTVDSIYLKSQEFHTWLVEERKINPETISKEVSKKEFARFVEDFNTGVLCSPYKPTASSYLYDLSNSPT
jgi:hypothetical protein